MDSTPSEAESSTEQRILDAVLRVLARRGIAGVTMRAVATEAGVAVGLANYWFDGKEALVSAALERIGERDLELVERDESVPPAEALDRSLRAALDPTLLTPEYLSLRLQLWSLAGVDDAFAQINRRAQRRYLDGLVSLIAATRPDLTPTEIERRAADILVVQNGVWLTSILILDDQVAERAIARCQEISRG